MPPKQGQASKAKKTTLPTAPKAKGKKPAAPKIQPSKVSKKRASQKVTTKQQTANSLRTQIPIGSNPYRFKTNHPKPIYFNSHSKGEYACFSNLFTVDGGITIDGITMPTAEHHIQYAKAVLFNDQQTAENIELASTPKEAQELGNRVENFNQEQWNKEKDKITQHIVFLKFENNSTLRSILKGTGDVPIAEASPDREGGVGYYKKDVEAKRMWWGENLQGLCLMDSRALIIHIDAEEKDGQNSMEDGDQKDLSKNGQNGQKDDVQEDGGGGPKPLGQDSQKVLKGGGPKPLGQDNQNGRKDDVQKDGGGGPKPLQQDNQKGLKNGGKDDPTAIISANDPESGIASKDLVKVGDVFQLLNFDIWEWKFDLEELRSPNNETPPLGGSGEGFERALLSEVHSYSRAIPLAVKAQFPANPVGSMTPDEVLKGLKKAKRLDPVFNWNRIAGEFLFWNGREDESKKEKYRPGPVHLHLVIVSKVGDTYEAIRASPQPGRAGHNVFLYSEKVVTEYAPTGEHRVCAMEPVRGV